MFTAPHEFAIDIPTLLSSVRTETYRTYAWPQRLATFFDRPALSATGGALFGLVFVTAIALASGDRSRLAAADVGAGAFYRVIPAEAMVLASALFALFALTSWIASGIGFARDARVSLAGLAGPAELWRIFRDAVTLRWMDGGGEGCYYPEPERRSGGRRALHALVVLGFLAANVSTALAAISEHALGSLPPYPIASGPVVFGIAGGVAMIVGTTGLLALKARAARLISREMLQLDWAFLAVLDLVSLTGMATLLLRTTPFMSAALIVHLATLAALFVTVPFGKFAHALYRVVALYAFHREAEVR